MNHDPKDDPAPGIDLALGGRLLVSLYGNAWEARVDGKSLGWFATENEARAAICVERLTDSDT
jgi:hypothetical protein